MTFICFSEPFSGRTRHHTSANSLYPMLRTSTAVTGSDHLAMPLTYVQYVAPTLQKLTNWLYTVQHPAYPAEMQRKVADKGEVTDRSENQIPELQ